LSGRRLLLAGAFALSLSCSLTAGDRGEAVRAEFGLFYGGQVQERREIPLEMDRARQLQGFRLELEVAPRSPLEVRWEVGMPAAGPLRRDALGRKARRRRTRLGRGLWRAGETRFEQTLPFAPGDPVGLWNLRVRVGSRVVLDRPFRVYDKRAQTERARRAAELDGGF